MNQLSRGRYAMVVGGMSFQPLTPISHQKLKAVLGMS
jgi:hypothetical protein